MKKIIFSCVFMFFSSVLLGALPQFFQSQKEIISLLSNQEVVEQLGSTYSIESISKKDLIYTIKTSKCVLAVEIIYVQRSDNILGPQQFKFLIAEDQCN